MEAEERVRWEQARRDIEVPQGHAYRQNDQAHGSRYNPYQDH